MFQCLPYSRFFLWRAFWLSGIFRFRQVIIYPLNNIAFLFYLCNIQVTDFQSAMLQHIILNFLIGSLLLRIGQIQLVHLYFNLDMFPGIDLDKSTTVSTWLDCSRLMSGIGNLSRLIWYVPKYLRLFVETYLQIL